jgi:hypothetical protein
VNGVMVQSQQEEVSYAVLNNFNTTYVNGPVSPLYCSPSYGGPGPDGNCTKYVIESITYMVSILDRMEAVAMVC